MNKLLCSILICSAVSFFAQSRKFFEKGEVRLEHPVEKINLRFENNLPFVQVNINGKFYNFLFDSGAPTVISSAIYTEMNLARKYRKSVKDSNNRTQQQIFTELTEMAVDHVVFRNVGAIVLDLNSAELGCLKVDGIIGANQMAKLFWRVNYTDNSLETTQDLSFFDLNDYAFILPFKTKSQKTPIITTPLFDKNIELTFDTGFSGRFEITGKNFNPGKATRRIETFGTRSTGAFGAGESVSGSIFRTDSLALGNKIFHGEIISTGTSDLMGNEFLRDFAFVLDWKNSKIYLKRLRNASPKLESFGFTYRFVNQKPVVAFVFEKDHFPLKIGDSIISINGVALDNLDQDSACYYFVKRIERDQKTIDIKIKRDGKILDFKMDKKEYLN